jgi:DNA helicase-2/ATP-dependent DNA helicase PcrA
MTLHNAKGLEFPVVFVTGLEEGLFPLARARETPSGLEEERRLFYVGITRAEDSLFLTHARGRRRNGEFLPSLPSSFLRELPAALVNTRSTVKLRGSGRSAGTDVAWGRWSGPSDTDDWPRATPSARRPGTPVVRSVTGFRPSTEEDESQDRPAFLPGERVQHARFGGGTIAEVSGSGRDAKVTVDFDDESIGRKRLVVAHAGLTRGVD